MPTYRITLEYEGTRYRGWQEQQNARSVAGELKRALAAAGASVQELFGSGRTDAGVHALEQVAHLRLVAPIEPERLLREVNDRLPPDIHARRLVRAHARFHARHDAVARSYLYQISRRRSAFGKRWVWWVRKPLEPGRIEHAAALLPGRHDFSLFCERPQDQPGTTVVVDKVEIGRFDDLMVVRLVASHFLWKMVRRIVGVLVRVGEGELDPDVMPGLLAGIPLPPRRGSPAQWTAPPSGLFLERVLYADSPPIGVLAPALWIKAPGRESTTPP